MTYYGSQDERKQIRKMVKKKKENVGFYCLFMKLPFRLTLFSPLTI